LKTPSAIAVDATRNINFQNCKFTKLGSGGLDIQNGTSDAEIIFCEFTQIAGSAIQVGDFTMNDAHPDDDRVIVKNNIIKNNEIHNIGTEYKGGVGILVGYTDGTVISHNSIYNTAFSGISVGWGWGYWDKNADDMICEKPLPHYPKFNKDTISKNIRVEYNHVHHVMQKLHDGGGIYTISMNSNSKIIGNLIHDNGMFDGIDSHEGVFRHSPSHGPEHGKIYTQKKGFPGGIYLDQASGGFEVTGNIVYNVVIPIFYHDYGMDNVFETNKIYDNFFNVKPGDVDFPLSKAIFSGVEESKEI
jgi:hypothetical protein